MENIKINKNGVLKRKKSVLIGVLKGLTVQAKKGGSVNGLNDKEYVLGDCSLNVLSKNGKIIVKDKNGLKLPCVNKKYFSSEQELIKRLQEGIKYPCKHKGKSNYKETIIFSNYLKFC